MVELLEKLDFSDCRHVHSVLVGDNLDLFDSHSGVGLDIPRQEHRGVRAFTDLLDLCIQIADRQVLRGSRVHLDYQVAFYPGWGELEGLSA